MQSFKHYEEGENSQATSGQQPQNEGTLLTLLGSFLEVFLITDEDGCTKIQNILEYVCVSNEFRKQLNGFSADHYLRNLIPLKDNPDTERKRLSQRNSHNASRKTEARFSRFKSVNMKDRENALKSDEDEQDSMFSKRVKRNLTSE